MCVVVLMNLKNLNANMTQIIWLAVQLSGLTEQRVGTGKGVTNKQASLLTNCCLS